MLASQEGTHSKRNWSSGVKRMFALKQIGDARAGTRKIEAEMKVCMDRGYSDIEKWSLLVNARL